MASIQSYQIKHMSEHLLEYLMNIIKSGVDNTTKMAAMAILLDCFKTADEDQQIRMLCLKNELVQALQMSLDVGLHSSKCIDVSDITYIDVALALLWQLIQLPTSQVQPAITEAFIRRLLGYLDVSSSFYHYSEDMGELLRSECESKVLLAVVECRPMSLEVVDCVRCRGGISLNDLEQLPDKVYQCTLFKADGEASSDIGDYLRMAGLSWTYSEEDYHERMDDSKEIFVVKVLKGGFFWAHIGESAMENVSIIQGVLNSPTAKLINCGASFGEYVAVSAQISDMECMIRCQVLESSMGMIKVFAVDYGFCLNVHLNSIFQLPAEVTMSEYPPQAFLSYIAGLHPPPMEAELVHSAAGILCNLCKKSFATGELISGMGGLDILKQILQLCPDNSITLQLIKLLNNLACNNKLGEMLASTKFMKSLIAICRANLHADNPYDKEPQRILMSAMSCICNLIYKNVHTKKEFYQSQGLEVVLRVIMMAKRFTAPKKLALKLLRIFVGDTLSSQAITSGNLYNHHHGKEREKQRESLSPIRRESLKDLIVEEDDNVTLHQKKYDLDETGRDSHSAWGTVTRAGGVFGSDEALHSLASDSEARVVDTADVYKKTLEEKFFVLDSRVDFDDDIMCELHKDMDVETISPAHLSQYVCGMMNTGKGGVIYFGIDKESRTVHGMYLTRCQRDDFRLGVDRMMNAKISPSLLHSQFDVGYIPVIENRSDAKSDDEPHPLTDRFVIEITLKATQAFLYTVKENGAYYYRFQSRNHQLRTQELRELVILDEEAKNMEEIQNLNDRLSYHMQKMQKMQ